MGKLACRPMGLGLSAFRLSFSQLLASNLAVDHELNLYVMRAL